MTGAINYLGLGIAIIMGAGIGYAIARYLGSDKEYRKKHKKELLRIIVEGSVFLMLGYLIHWFAK